MAKRTTEKVKSVDGKEVHLDTWIEEEGQKVMYSRERPVNICNPSHKFDSNHECTRCPYVFVGFRSNIHIQTEDGIFERKPSHQLGKRLA